MRSEILRLVGIVLITSIVAGCAGTAPPPPLGTNQNIFVVKQDTDDVPDSSTVLADHMADPTPFHPYACVEVLVKDSALVTVLLVGRDFKEISAERTDTIACESLLPGQYNICWPHDPPNGLYKHQVRIGDYTYESRGFLYDWHRR